MKRIAFLFTCCSLWAATAFAQTGLSVGQSVPDVPLAQMLGHTAPTAQLSQFRGKLLILDFWATWCAPCVASFPKLDSLQRQFSGRLQILPVTYQSAKEVNVFLDRLQRQKNTRYRFPMMVGDTALHRLFPHQALPHYVWVDASGTVRAITESKALTAANIEAMLKGNPLAGGQKTASPPRRYDPAKPLTAQGATAASPFPLFASVLMGYQETLPLRWDQSVATATPEPVRKITVLNSSLAILYQVAFSQGRTSFRWNRTVLEVQDSSRLYNAATGQAYLDWLRGGSGYCYELVVPPTLVDSAWVLMQRDLHRLFPQYRASVEVRPTPCLALERTSPAEDRLKSKGGTRAVSLNRTGGTVRAAPLSYLVRELNNQGVGAMVAPVINRTGYSGPVDITLDANLTDVASLNRALEAYGLRLSPVSLDVEVLVIRDQPQAGQASPPARKATGKNN